MGHLRGLWWGHLSSSNFPFILAVSFQLLITAKIPFWVWFLGLVFLFFQNWVLLFDISRAEPLLVAG